MAAWSPDEDVVAEFRPLRLNEVLDALSTVPTEDPETPATPSGAFPIEVWTFFSDSDLDQLVVDACAEMGRRELARGVDSNA